MDTLSVIILCLVGFVGLIIGVFSWRNLSGDSRQVQFLGSLVLMIGAVFALVVADHMLVFLGAWAASNTLLARLMIHKSAWRAAQASGVLALQNFGLGFAALSGAFALLYSQTGETSIHNILSVGYSGEYLPLILMLLIVAAMTQSAIWPFHQWLTSSLNSPTAVSAIMHAGLVNGGGFLLARFAPLLVQMPGVLSVLFVIGMITATLGTLWKLMQSDIKRMLACSTMGQMGFMMVQCGLGLFPAAIAHLCWHGLFKAYLFLGIGGTARERRLDLGYPPPLPVFLLALVCGVGGGWVFALISRKDLLAGDTTLFLVGLAGLATAQLAIAILAKTPWQNLFGAILASAVMGGLYGLSVHSVELLLSDTGLMQPQPLELVHLLGFGLLFVAWVAMLYGGKSLKEAAAPAWALRVYVRMLNQSQPHPKTVTTHRNHYRYL